MEIEPTPKPPKVELCLGDKELYITSDNTFVRRYVKDFEEMDYFYHEYEENGELQAFVVFGVAPILDMLEELGYDSLPLAEEPDDEDIRWYNDYLTQLSKDEIIDVTYKVDEPKVIVEEEDEAIVRGETACLDDEWLKLNNSRITYLTESILDNTDLDEELRYMNEVWGE